ncbi:MAG: hypothetical protein JKY34_15930 [Kordiimonadaceae bacterium]|nr:hypothetical protein [Kordiimonadaceae bacterium]
MNIRTINLQRMTQKIPTLYRRVLYVTLSASWVTGIVFFILRDFIIIEGDFGPEKHPWQYPALMVHGLAAFFMIIGFGGLLFAHIPYSWRSKRQRLWGLTLISAVAFQIITAYLLYYMNSELSREVVGYFHLGIGGLLPFLLITHIISGIRSRKS